MCASVEFFTKCDIRNFGDICTEFNLNKLNKLFVADVPDEDSQLSKIIEVVTTVYDHQNFLTKGFLSKISGIQYQHIVSEFGNLENSFYFC